MFIKHFPQYESSCFSENIREVSIKHGLTYLIDKLLFNILNKQIHSSVVLGSSFIKKRVSSLKVFMVLDNVDNFWQLEYLCGEHGYLGQHSRLIITIGDRKMLEGNASERAQEIEIS